MKFVLDTNVFLKALIKKSVVRGIILGSNHEFLIPSYLIEEVGKHVGEVEKKSGLSRSEIKSVIDALLAKTLVVPVDQVLSKWDEAEEMIRIIDESDTPFVAAALSTGSDGVWSDDRYLERQGKVRVWTTREVVRLSGHA